MTFEFVCLDIVNRRTDMVLLYVQFEYSLYMFLGWFIPILGKDSRTLPRDIAHGTKSPSQEIPIYFFN